MEVIEKGNPKGKVKMVGIFCKGHKEYSDFDECTRVITREELFHETQKLEAVTNLSDGCQNHCKCCR